MNATRLPTGFVLAIVVLSGCATSPPAPQRSPTLAHVPVLTLPDGHEAVLVRSHVDEWKLVDAARRVSVQYLWDYTAAVARKRTIDAAGVVLEDRLCPGLTLDATDEELAWAWEVARGDPQIASRLSPGVVFSGGFSVREPGHRYCNRGSRCVQLIGSRDGGRKAFRALVDLQAARVVDPDYDPAWDGFDDESPQ